MAADTQPAGQGSSECTCCLTGGKNCAIRAGMLKVHLPPVGWGSMLQFAERTQPPLRAHQAACRHSGLVPHLSQVGSALQALLDQPHSGLAGQCVKAGALPARGSVSVLFARRVFVLRQAQASGCRADQPGRQTELGPVCWCCKTLGYCGRRVYSDQSIT